MSVADISGEMGYDQYRCTLYANAVHSTASVDSYTWQLADGDVIDAISGSGEYLEQGGRYLMLLDPSEGGPYIEPARVAKINDDGTIAAISPVREYMPYTNVFEEFNGYTVGQMAKVAERAKAWHERYAA